MSDIIEPVQEAPAAAPVGVPISDSRSTPSKAIKTEGPSQPEAPPEPKGPREKVGLDDAVDRALNGAKKEVPAKTEPVVKDAKPVEKEAPARGEGGKFAPKAPEAGKAPEPSDDEAPARFSAEAKAVYKEAPEPVRREINRAIKELTDGIEKYRPDREFRESLKEYDEIARKEGTTVKAAMDQYTAISRGLTSPDMSQKLTVIKDIFDHAGLNLREFASAVMGQPQDQQASATDSEIRELRQTIRTLQQQVGGVTGTIEQQKNAQIMSVIDQFAADKPRFDELAEDITFFLDTKKAKDLAEAYEMANRFNPAPSAPALPAAAPAPAAAPQPLNPAGGKSISGAPFSGSDLRPRKGPPPSLDEALDRAFQRLA